MTLSIQIISDLNALGQVSADWDNFLKIHSENPFLFTNFLFQVISSNPERIPLFLILRYNEKIIGLAPLHLTSKFGIRSAEFFLKPELNPDFVIEKKYFNEGFKIINNFLFNFLKCSFLSLTLDQISATLTEFRSNKVYFVSDCCSGSHLILNLPKNIEEYKKLVGKQIRQDVKRTEGRLNASGTWKVLKCDEQTVSPVIPKILSVDSASWKKVWRSHRKIKSDSGLLVVLNAFSSSVNDFEKKYLWLTWILELNGSPISYQIALINQRNSIAFFVKTGYDNNYKSYSPGVYVCNFAICDLLENSRIQKIDFLTNLEYLKRWKTENHLRVNVIVSQNFLAKIIQFFITNQRLKPLMRFLSRVFSSFST
jgi:hypothetical protein